MNSNANGFLETIKKSVVFEDVPFAHQLGGAVALTLGAGIGAQLMGVLTFSEWRPWVVYWIGGIVAAPHVLKGVANLLRTLGLSLLFVQKTASTAMLEVGKFCAFALVLLGLTATAAHAGHVHQFFSLPIPDVFSLGEWIAAYAAHPVFLILVVVSFVIYRGGVYYWRHRPVGVDRLHVPKWS